MKRLTLEQAGIFHGHVGPFLTIGYLAGQLAVSLLNPKDEFDLCAEVKIPLKTPYSCILDGIRCSSSCTFGKNNIKAINSDDFTLTFKCKSSGKKCRIKIMENILKVIKNMRSLEEGVEYVLSRKQEEIFKIEL